MIFRYARSRHAFTFSSADDLCRLFRPVDDDDSKSRLNRARPFVHCHGLRFAMAFACGLPAREITWHIGCGALILLLGFGLFARGWIGGGDAKLAAATAIWLGFDHLGQYALFASALGGLLTLLIIGLREWPLPGVLAARTWIARLHAPSTGVPYGIALASAGLLLYPETTIWLATAAMH
jgi:prepilin peptidase CpaA